MVQLNKFTSDGAANGAKWSFNVTEKDLSLALEEIYDCGNRLSKLSANHSERIDSADSSQV